MRSVAGAALGIFLALVSAFLAFLTIGAYPFWAFTILVIDGLVIYGLTQRGGRLIRRVRVSYRPVVAATRPAWTASASARWSRSFWSAYASAKAWTARSNRSPAPR